MDGPLGAAARAWAALMAVAFATAAAEAVTREIDGYQVFSLALRPSAGRSQPTARSRERPDRRHADAVPIARGVERRWYEDNPPPIERLPIPPAVQARLDRYPTDQIGAVALWNLEYLRREICGGRAHGSVATLSDFYVFESADHGPYPTYRHMPHLSPPGVFVSNAFGWRGPDLTTKKPSNTIRIAFVGASTTSDDYSFPFSHPELIGRWLDLWAEAGGLPYRFEVINTGRTGIDSSSIAAIVRLELRSADPDLVIYYEGANDFEPLKELNFRRIPARPQSTFRQRTRAEAYSAIVRRAEDAVWLIRGGEGSEPKKSGYRVIWPVGVDERNPDVTSRQLPMDLDRVVANLDAMRTSLAEAGSEFAMSSFIWMVFDGMRLDLSRHLTLYRYLNDTFWPVPYAHMRRMADFQNRVFRNYATRYGLAFFEIAEPFPRDPDLFSDAIHMTPDGLRLQAWIYFQQLVPLIESRLASRRWPRASSAPSSAAWVSSAPQVVSRAEIEAKCANR